MSSVLRVLPSLLLLLLLNGAGNIALGQTEHKDPSVTVAVEDQSVPSIARPTQVGSTIVVWEE